MALNHIPSPSLRVATGAFAPSDTVNPPTVVQGGRPGFDGFLVTGAGVVPLVSDLDLSVTNLTVNANQIYMLHGLRINATGLTATGLVYLYSMTF